MNQHTPALGYTAMSRPLIEPLQQCLAEVGLECSLQLVEAPCEQQAVVQLVHEQEAQFWLGCRQTPQSPQQVRQKSPIIVLTEAWTLDSVAYWLEQGAVACEASQDPPRLAALILQLARRQDKASLATGAFALDAPPLLQAVLDAIPAPVFYKDADHIYRGCNEAFSQCLGFPKHQILGASVYDIAPRELADIYFEADRELLASRGTQRYEAQVRYADGALREIEFNKAVYFDAAGEPAGQVGVMLDVTDRNEFMRKLEQASCTDALTGIGNRRAFTEVSRREIARCERNGQALSLLILDVDHFKQINDVWGHQAGDEVLVRLVQRLVEQLRSQDQLFRVGGEEFYLLLPETEVEQAFTLAERLRQGLNGQRIELDQGSLLVTVSIGVAQFQAQESLDQCMRRADRALYHAKSDGRDRVRCAAP